MKSRTLKSHLMEPLSNSFSGYSKDKDYLFPPRSYHCSFCKRNFMSAQALGGHMNVHRRERATLRHLYSLKTQNHEDSSKHHDLQLSSTPSFAFAEKLSPTRVSAFTDNTFLCVQEKDHYGFSCLDSLKTEGDSAFTGLTMALSSVLCENNEALTSQKRAKAYFSREQNLPFAKEALGFKLSSKIDELDLELRL